MDLQEHEPTPPVRSWDPALGFTLIEIVLVLAIAGLIMVIVFLAIAGAQRARRDYQRKQDLAEFTSDVQSFESNHGGLPPQNAAEATTFSAQYLSNLKDPLTGAPYNVTYRFIDGPHDTIPAVGQILYQAGHWCNTGAGFDAANPTNPIAGNIANTTRFVVWTGLEVGGILPASSVSGVWYCLDNY